MKEVTLYVTHYCSFCHAAANYLQAQAYPHKVIYLDDQPELRQRLSAENNGWRTVPMIFIGQEFIGGYNDMMVLVKNGQFAKMLNE